MESYKQFVDRLRVNPPLIKPHAPQPKKIKYTQGGSLEILIRNLNKMIKRRLK